jgi:hypothetical protein
MNISIFVPNAPLKNPSHCTTTRRDQNTSSMEHIKLYDASKLV